MTGIVEHPAKSPAKLEGVAQSAGGVCENEKATHSSVSGADSPPNLGAQNSESPAKLEGVARSAGGVCENEKATHSSVSGADSSPSLGAQNSESPAKLEGVSEGQGRVSIRAKNTENLKEFRRKLRNNSTSAEVALWNVLKGKKIAGLQFRRQFSIGNFILDFYCPLLKLAVELDGNYHDFVDVKDLERGQYLFENFGIKTIRFENKIVFQQPGAIVNSILNELQESKFPAKLEGVAQSASGVCENEKATHSSVSKVASSPSLGAQNGNSDSNSPTPLAGRECHEVTKAGNKTFSSSVSGGEK